MRGVATRSLVTFVLVSILLACTTVPRTAQPAFAAEAGLRVGVAYGNRLLFKTDEKLAEALDDAVDIGADWIRVDLSWADVQPSSAEEYVWNPFDRIVAQAFRRGLSVLPILAYTPAWARRSGCANDHCAPADPAQFATFAGAAAQRYANRGVHTWEIWNEPNSAIFWQPSADPVSYTRLLRAASAAIRAADHKAFVLLGGLATLATADGNISIADFVSQSEESPLRLVDALAVHPYTYPYPGSRLGPWASPWLPTESGLPYLRRVLAESGTPDLPIWITEYGAPTGGPGHAWDGSPDSLSSGPDHVTEAQQAEIAGDAIATAASDPIIGSLFWYTDRDFAAPTDTTENYYGLIRADSSKKPAYAALRDAVKSLTQ